VQFVNVPVLERDCARFKLDSARVRRKIETPREKALANCRTNDAVALIPRIGTLFGGGTRHFARLINPKPGSLAAISLD